MGKISYVNGIYSYHKDAVTHIEDRGYQFADGVYEVIAFRQRCLINKDEHFKRLWRSLKELEICHDFTENSLFIIIQQLIKRNNVIDGIIYLQITRGTAKRAHEFPANVAPNIVITVMRSKFSSLEAVMKGQAAVTYEENRWQRRDIKSVSLLANVLAKEYAIRSGAKEAIYVNKEGYVTEGSSSNCFIITEKNILKTHPATNEILHGITRGKVIEIAKNNGYQVVEEKFALEEAFKAKEIFITVSSLAVIPIIKLDNVIISNGVAGEVTKKLAYHYQNYIEELVKNYVKEAKSHII